MKHLQGTTMPSKYNEFFFRKEGLGAQEGSVGCVEEGQTPPTMVVSMIDYTSPEKTAKTQSCLLHANNEETTTP